jgi:GH43 family beta-xylosidase
VRPGPGYRNPVYAHSFPDPFVLKFRGEYWAYCTGFWHDGRAFGILRSPDLVQWREQTGALEPLPGNHPCYWAPEVAYLDGRFYLYFSVGNEEHMEIRVAVADHPAGPFVDSGRRLTSEPFAIDAHVFVDQDGSRWLFYATDFLDRSHVGTGTVRDRMLDPFTLEGRPLPVALPRRDWHVYHPNRPEKGFVRWHTVEGPFVLYRKGLYYEMFSGGNWQNSTYGVSYATARSLDDPQEWVQAADGVRALPILRTGGEVVGPGHNSVVRGPDNRQLYCVYHRWSPDLSARVLAIDPLDWAGERMLVLGPTTTPQSGPNPPTISDEPVLLRPGEERGYETPATSFLVEVTVRGGAWIVLRDADEHEMFRVGAGLDGGVVARPALPGAASTSQGGSSPRPFVQTRPYPKQDFHLRLEVDGRRASFAVDGLPAWEGTLVAPARRLLLASQETAAEFAGFALTAGWEDLFLEDGDPRERGWEILAGEWRISGGRLQTLPSTAGEIAHSPLFEDYELVVNARGGDWIVAPAAVAAGQNGAGPRWVLQPLGEGWALVSDEQILPLPAGFDPMIDQQLRFRKAAGNVEISWEGQPLGDVSAPAGPTWIALGTAAGAASFEAVRITVIPSG